MEKDVQKGITDILVAIGKLETEIKQISGIASKLDNTEKLTLLIEQSVKSAHKRIDHLEEDFEKFEQVNQKQRREDKEDKKWMLGFFAGGVAIIWKLIDYIKGVI